MSAERQNLSSNVTTEQHQNVTLLDTDLGDFGQPVHILSNQNTADNLQIQQNYQQQTVNPISSTTAQILQSSPIVSANFVNAFQMLPQYQHPQAGLHPTRGTTPLLTGTAYQQNTNIVDRNLH